MFDLSKNNDIIITPNKGGGVVMMDSAQYNNEIIELLDDIMNKLHNKP